MNTLKTYYSSYYVFCSLNYFCCIKEHYLLKPELLAKTKDEVLSKSSYQIYVTCKCNISMDLER